MDRSNLWAKAIQLVYSVVSHEVYPTLVEEAASYELSASFVLVVGKAAERKLNKLSFMPWVISLIDKVQADLQGVYDLLNVSPIIESLSATPRGCLEIRILWYLVLLRLGHMSLPQASFLRFLPSIYELAKQFIEN